MKRETKQIKIGSHRYRIRNTGYSSKRFGNCEVCNNHVSEVFHQVKEEKYNQGWLEVSSLYGCKNCLEAQRKNNETKGCKSENR